MSLTKKIAHNTIFQFSGKIIGTILGLISIGLITRNLGQAGFGHYTIILGFLQFFGILVDFGLSLTTSQMLGHSKWDEDYLLGNLLSLRVVSAALFLGVAPLVVLFFPYPTFVKWGIALMTLSFFFMSISQIFLGLYQKKLQLKYYALSEIGNRLFLLVAIIVSVVLGWGLFGILISILLSNAVQLLMLYFPARKLARISFVISAAVWKDIWIHTWPIALSIALNLLYLKTDIIFLSIFRSPEEVGLYGAAYKVVDVLTTFPILFAGILLPLLANYWQSGARDQFKELVQNGFDAMSLLAWPLIVGTLFVGADVMAIIAGEQFRESGLILQLLIWATAIIFFNAVFAHAIVALNKQKSTIIAYAVSAAIGLVGYVIFIPKYGALGAATITVATELLVAVVVFLYYLKFSGIFPSFKRWLSAGVSCAVMAGSLWLTRDQHIVLQILLAVVVYGVALVATRGVSKAFLRDLFRLQQLS